MILRSRQKDILNRLSRDGTVLVNTLADAFGVSAETIRRDLSEMAENGLLRKVYGGAVPIQTATEPTFEKRDREERSQGQERIAAVASQLFPPGSSLFVDAGTTAVAFAAHLSRREGFTVITNALEVAIKIGDSSPSNEAIMLGGAYSSKLAETLGPTATAQVSQYSADYAVLICGAVSTDGELQNFVEDQSALAQAMHRAARSTTILADHTKLGCTALHKICGMREIDRLVTDHPPPAPIRRLCNDLEVELIVTDDS